VCYLLLFVGRFPKNYLSVEEANAFPEGVGRLFHISLKMQILLSLTPVLEEGLLYIAVKMQQYIVEE
jgi:hypothetical protein